MLNNLGAKLHDLRKQNNMTLEEVGNAVGVGKSTVRKWETGEIANMRRDKISKLAEALHTTPAYLMGWDESLSVAAVRVPVLGKVAAGIPITAVENIIDYEEIPSSMAETGEYVALQIKGSSMEPRMFEGDVVIVKVQPSVDSGDVAVVIVNGNEATVKKVQLRPDGIVLQPFNSAYDPMFYTNEDIESVPVRIFGKVVECRQKY